jgi:hypothetical protein
MRNTILFGDMLEGDLTDKSGDLFTSVFDLAKEEENKIKQENDTRIDEDISSSLQSEYLPQETQ